MRWKSGSDVAVFAKGWMWQLEQEGKKARATEYGTRVLQIIELEHTPSDGGVGYVNKTEMQCENHSE